MFERAEVFITTTSGTISINSIACSPTLQVVLEYPWLVNLLIVVEQKWINMRSTLRTVVWLELSRKCVIKIYGGVLRKRFLHC